MSWDQLREWLKGDGAAWTQWAQTGDIASDIADDVLERFGLAPTRSGRARLRREVDAVELAAVRTDARRDPARLMSVRQRGDGRYEILTAVDSLHGETWEPLATTLVRLRMLEGPEGTPYPITLDEALKSEGWISPSEDLTAHVCGARNFREPYAGARCLLRRNHTEPFHQGHGITWTDEVAAVREP